jgi:hypothetical protein
MGEPRPELGVMAAPEELIDALHALGAIRAPSRAERARIERQSARAASCSVWSVLTISPVWWRCRF